MKIKRIITCIISCILFMVYIPFTATAKVIEPEVVKTEKWTTSYYIDDDIDTLYPYIQCEADIYNDGTIKLYMWNTHEWDGFATVGHNVTLSCTLPVSDDSMLYAFKKYKKYINGTIEYMPITVESYNSNFSKPHSDRNYEIFTYFDIVDMSYFPKQYNCDYTSRITDEYWSDYHRIYYCLAHSKDGSINGTSNTAEPISFISKRTYLSKLGFSNNRRSVSYYFTPIEDPIGTYNFRLFGHDIIITPDLLSGNIVSEPILTEQEQHIKQLEEENKKLKEQLNNPYTGYITIEQNNGTAAERFPVTVYSDGRTETTEEFQNYINSLNVKIEQLMNRINLISNGSCGDIDGDGNISVEDAQLLLQYYTESKVAQLTDDPIDVWYSIKYGG